MFAPWRIPTFVSRPWRLIPELDRFSDEQCARYASHLRKERFLGLIAAAGTALIVGPAVSILVGLFIESVLEPLVPSIRNNEWDDPLAFQLTWLGAAAVVIGTTLWLALTPYLLLVRRGLLRRLAMAGCPFCAYSLLGLPVTSGRVTCPECGRGVDLGQHGIREEDVMAGEVPTTAAGAGRTTPLVRATLIGGHSAGGIGLVAWLVYGWPLLMVALIIGYLLFLVLVAHLHGLGRTDWRARAK